jgi:hypothetical protein
VLLFDGVPNFFITRERYVTYKRRDDTTTLPHEVFGLTDTERMPALLRFSHHREGGVFVDFERGERVSDEKDMHGGMIRRML